MLERIAEFKRQAQEDLEHEKAAFTSRVAKFSYSHSNQFGGIEGVVLCELICTQFNEINGETDELIAQNVERYRERITRKLISENPRNEAENLLYKAMRFVLEQLSHL